MDTAAQPFPAQLPVQSDTRPSSTDTLRKRLRVDVPIDEARSAGRSYGGLLLYYREAIFDKIHRSEGLNEMICYFGLHSLLFSAIYGALLGCFTHDLQILSGAVKLPLLLWGTTAICLPALFTFNVLLGSKLSLKQTTAVLSMSTYLMSTVVASLSPILLFFAISAHQKSFIILLSVVCCGIAGVFGVSLLWNAMGYLTLRSGSDYNSKIVRSWTLIYVFVGTQFAWILRPLVGDPGHFMLFRHLAGNFYTGTLQILIDFLGR